MAKLNSNIGTWQSGIITTQTYGVLYGHYNTTIKIAFLSWNGNATAPTAGLKTFTLPTAYTPRQNSTTPLRNADSIEVRTDGHVQLTFSATAWSGGAMMYPLA